MRLILALLACAALFGCGETSVALKTDTSAVSYDPTNGTTINTSLKHGGSISIHRLALEK